MNREEAWALLCEHTQSDARAVSREELLKGAEEIGVPFDEHVQNVIHAMSTIADELGL